jgi:hypothetical protein
MCCCQAAAGIDISTSFARGSGDVTPERMVAAKSPTLPSAQQSAPVPVPAPQKHRQGSLQGGEAYRLVRLSSSRADKDMVRVREGTQLAVFFPALQMVFMGNTREVPWKVSRMLPK